MQVALLSLRSVMPVNGKRGAGGLLVGIIGQQRHPPHDYVNA
jgi:hypothetical protein